MRIFADVHDSHCCKKHGCKYNSIDCTVESGLHQGIKCEMCKFDDEDRQKICTEYDLIDRTALLKCLEDYELLCRQRDLNSNERSIAIATIAEVIEIVKIFPILGHVISKPLK